MTTQKFEDFPESETSAEGMKVLQGDQNNIEPKVQDIQPVYAVKDGKELHIRFIFPVHQGHEEEKYPLLVFIQGSAWKEQSMNNHVMDLYEIVKSGVAAAIVQYRPSTLAPFPAQVQDAKSAVRYLVQHAPAYPIDINNIFLAGDSSGGHTALCSLATWEDGRLDDEGTPLPALRGCIDFYGPTHLEQMNYEPSLVEHRGEHSPEGLEIGGYDVVDKPELAYRCSPVAYFKERQNIPPLLILHGSKDTQVPFGQSVILYERLKELKIDPGEFYQVKGADHGGSLFWCQAVKDVVIDFINRCVSDPYRN